MAEDAIDQLGAGWMTEAELTPEVVEPEPVAAETEVIETEEPVETAETVAEPVVESAKPVMVPLGALEDERRKRQEAERRAAALEAPRAPQPNFRDAYEDPKGFSEDLAAEMEKVRFDVRAEMSGRHAETVYGKETVEAAIAWAQEKRDPAMGLKVQSAASPVEFIVQEYQQSRTLETLAGKPLEQWAEDFAKAKGWIVSPGETPALKPSVSTPPRSLASTPGSGKAAPKDADWGGLKFALDR